jgi:hypothetical protein
MQFSAVGNMRGIVLSLSSGSVESIQHFASRPQQQRTQDEDQERGHFSLSSWQS